MKVTESRNWNPDCPVHGTESDWWRSDEQVAARAVDSARLRALQAEARRRRAGGAYDPSFFARLDADLSTRGES